jgi:hypothetical protein
MDLVNEIQTLQKQLTASVNRLKENGCKLAEAERNYKVALNKKVLTLRSENMAATLINLIIHGEEDVANLRLERDIAKTVYETNQEHINATKLNIRIIENQIAREWRG